MRAGRRRWASVLIACVPAVASLLGLRAQGAQGAATTSASTMAEVLAASHDSDWRTLDPADTLYLELAGGRVVIELAPAFAPRNVANVLALAREHYYDGLWIERVQDDYVVQWGDPQQKRSTGTVPATVAAEFSRPAAGLSFIQLPDPDTYAPQVGFVAGFPVARDSAQGSAWLVHCYGMVGAARDDAADSGGGRELYAVIGQAPRSLDRNITLLGRVVWGMERLSSLPRGMGALGFYEQPSQRTRISAVEIAADVPDSQRTPLQLLRTDTATFQALIRSRRDRSEAWFKRPAGRIDVCSVPLPVRQSRSAASHPD